MLLLSTYAIQMVQSFTSAKRITPFIIDDSMFERNRSKKVELLARFKDHAKNCYYKGFRMLTLGWTDGHTFIPIDFSLLRSLKTIQTQLVPGIPVKVVFVRHRTHKNELLAILSTDCSLTEEEIIRIEDLILGFQFFINELFIIYRVGNWISLAKLNYINFPMKRSFNKFQMKLI